MREFKIKYIVVRENGHIFGETFPISDIENGRVISWLNLNNVGGSDVAHRLEFTGLHDKNGVEIYEGDILHRPGGASKIFPNVIEVKWCEETAEFAIPNKSYVARTCEIIGNIHENTELLEAT